MDSHEVLRAAFKKVGCKAVAAEMHLSLSLIHQWSRGHGGHSDALNPLDRVARLLEVTDDRRLADWICARENGFFVANPPVKDGRLDLPAARRAALRELIQVEAALLETEAQPLSPARVGQLRRLWEASKSDTERLVRVLERGECRRSAESGQKKRGRTLLRPPNEN